MGCVKIFSFSDSRSPNFFKKFSALFIRNIIYMLRTPIRTIMPLIVTLICFGFLLMTGTDTYVFILKF
jgi:hypothetical protein